MAKRQKKADIYSAGKMSSRYEGMPEHNPSHYVLLEVCKTTNTTTNNNNGNNKDDNPSVQVTLLPAPPSAYVIFSQPAARKTLTMSEAEQAIQDQRNNMTRYMMHDKNKNSILMNPAHAKPVNQSKARLLGKLVQKQKALSSSGEGGGGPGPGEGNEDADDIMGDVAFRERKGNAKARKELLTSLGDEGVKVDDDGVLGGANDDEFGGKRHFGAFKASEQDQTKGEGEDGGKNDKGNGGMAMEDGFYQRDVMAEYEELDYDVNEQFDDDDVDVGETEVVVDGGFAQEEDEDDDVDEDMDGGGEAISGAEGLASVAGFKAMLAKARGEGTNDPNQAADGTDAAANGADAGKVNPGKPDKPNAKKQSAKEDENDPLGKLFGAADDYRKKVEEANDKPAPKAGGDDEPDIAAVGPDGLRLITLEAIRHEIWLQRGQIPMKRLLKLFKVGKNPERRNKFREVVKELCIMKSDPVAGSMLVLKQHYRK